MARRIANGAMLGAIFVAYVLLAAASRELGVFGSLSVFYLPAGLALGTCVLVGWRVVPVLAVAELVSGVVVFDIHTSFSILQMVLNAAVYATLWGTAGHVIARLDDRAPKRLVSTMYALSIGAIAAPAIAGVVGVAFRAWAGEIPPGMHLEAMAIWATGDAVGVLTIMPTVVNVGRGLVRGVLPRSLREPAAWTVVATLLLPAAVAVGLFAVARDGTHFIYLVIAPMCLVALRHGRAGAGLAGLALSPVVTALSNEAIGALVLDRIDMQVLLAEALSLGLLLGAAVDERRAAGDKLQENQVHLDQAQELANMGSFVWLLERDQVTWSPNLHRLFGRPLDDPPRGAEDYLTHVHDEDREAVGAAIGRAIATGEPFDHEYRALPVDGEPRWMHARGEAIIDDDGNVLGLTGFCQDVSEHRRVAGALQDASEREAAAAMRERDAADRLREADAAKDALLMAVSHEVRTPLSVVRGIAATLLRPGLVQVPQEAVGLLARLDHQAQRLEELLADLLDIERLGRGQVRVLRSRTDVRAVLERAVERSWRADTPPEVEVRCATAHVDPGLLERIVSNLVANAERYASPGPVRVWADLAGDDLVVGVDDSGPGVAEVDRQAIFQRFYQVTRLEHAPGTGVGLYLVSRFAELHGGRAWVEDSPLGGAGFRARLADARERDTVSATADA